MIIRLSNDAILSTEATYCRMSCEENHMCRVRVCSNHVFSLLRVITTHTFILTGRNKLSKSLCG